MRKFLLKVKFVVLFSPLEKAGKFEPVLSSDEVSAQEKVVARLCGVAEGVLALGGDAGGEEVDLCALFH